MGKEAVIAIDQIETLFFVRAKLDEEHALHLAELVESGVKLPPIEVAELLNDDGEKVTAVVDGRHRLHAYGAILDRKSIPVVFVHGDKEELILRAMRANTGGSLATGGNDINLVIRQLLNMNVPKTRIIQAMSQPNLPFTPSLIRRHLEDVNNRMIRDRVASAQRAVADGKITTVEAAEKYNVKLASLQTALGGKKKKVTRVNDVIGSLSTISRSKSALISRQMMKVFDMYEDGDISAAHVQKILDKLLQIVNTSWKMHKDWVKRFEDRKALLKKQDEA